MPIEVDVPDLGVVEFPDGTSEDQIQSVLKRETKRKELDLLKQDLKLQSLAGKAAEKGIDVLGGALDIVSRMNPFRQAVDLPLTVGRAIGLDEPESFAPIVTPEQAQAAWDALHPSARNLPEELRVPSKLDAEIAEGVSRFVGENVSGMTSPSVAAPMIAGVAAPRMLAPAAARTVTEPIARGFQTEMIESLPAAIERLRQAKTLPEQIVAGGNVALGAGLPLAIERGLAPRAGRVAPPERPPSEAAPVAEPAVAPPAEAAAKPSAEPVPAPETVRLWRGETPPVPPIKGSEASALDRATFEPEQLRGQWWTEDKSIAERYTQRAGKKEGELYFVDVPKSELESYRISNLPEGAEAKSSSLSPSKEFILPKDIIASKQVFSEAEAPLPESPAETPRPAAESPATAPRNWDAFYEELVGELDAFAPARESVKGVDYSLQDMAQRFVEFVKNDTSGRPPTDLVKDFSKVDEASESQIRKLRQSLKGISEQTPPVQPEPAQAEIAPGPGAASPAEFALRQRGGAEPPVNQPVAIDASAKPDIEVARKNKDYHVFNRANSGQWAFDFGRLGQAAKAAWERMALGEFKMRESIKRDIDTYVNGVMSSLPREMRSSGGKAFFDVLDGKKMEQITAEWESKPGGDKVIAAAESLKTRLEEIRSTIRDTKRESYRGYLQGLERSALEDLFKKNINDKIDTSAMTKEQFGDALTLNEFPDDWGIADGSYLPHLFFGSWKISAKLPGEEGAGFVARAETAAQAKAKIYELSKNNPEYANAQWTVGQDVVITPDMIRLGDKKFWNMISRMKEQTAGEVNVKEAVQGIIGRKAGKQKWFGSLQERLGFKNYSRDFRNVMGAYLNGFHRWKELSEMQRETQPLIERVKAEGRPNAARRLEDLMENLWGKPAATTLEFDSFVQRIPGLRDYIKPLALDRWSRNIRSMVSLLTLSTLRFALINRLQPLQGLYPLVGERLLIKGKAFQHSPEGNALLDEAGVRLDPGQYAESRAGVSKVRDFMERFRGERSNQELAFLSMYLHGVEQGMPKAEAIKYAKLRGQLMTQFTPLVVDTPQMLHGPIASMMFQFKRFPIKQAELTANMVREGNIGGIARMLAVFALVGGASVFLRQAWTDPEKRLALRRKLEKEMGSKGADALMYGLPGLLNADLSGSLVLAEEPFGDDVFSKAARTVAGPAVSIAAETTRAAMTEEREPMSAKDKAVTLMRRFPGLRPITELMTFGDDEILSPDGEIKYRRKVQDALVGLGAFRSANEANMQTAVSAIVELKKEDQRLKNAYYVARTANADLTGIRAEIDAFNKRWPEVRITAQDLADYVQYRRRNRDKTDVERVAGKKYRKLLPQ